MRFAPDRAKRRHATGFSLLEVLIALVILSVGLLGLAALQAEGLRGSSSALQRTTAVSHASDIADRMRSNRDGLSDYVVAIGKQATAGAAHACMAAHSGGTPVAANVCTSQEMALHDLFVWKAEMGGSNYDGSVTAVGGTANQFVLVVQWTDRTLAANNTQTYTTNIQF